MELQSQEQVTLLKPSLSRVIWILMILMAFCIGRAAVSQNVNLLDLHLYEQIKEHAPFQNRILMAYILRYGVSSPMFLRLYYAQFVKTVATPEDLVVMLTNCLCLFALLPVTVAIRRRFLPSEATSWLAPLLMLLVVTFTYVVRYEQRFTMPYDIPSLLLFNLGLLAILQRRGWLMLLVLAVAIPNRESSIFLVPVWLWLEWREGRRRSAVVYSLIGIALSLFWRRQIALLMPAAAATYDFPWKNNLVGLLVPWHLPQTLSFFAFLAIPMWMLRGAIKDPRLKAVWISTAPLLVTALAVGIWRETRIVGELSVLVAVTFAIQLEEVLSCHSSSATPLST